MAEPHPFGAEPPRTADPLVGVRVGGRYTILRVIGTGGMGVVYQALHEELGRPVAIKVLGAAWASDELAIQRFLREARTASNIGHPNIVMVHDMGRLDDGRPYLVMELLCGTSLADLLDSYARLPPERVSSIIAELASALDAVHAKRIIHRDIKPENVLLVDADPEPPKPKLLDFGLAAFAIPSAESARLTRHGQVHGTPHYMAPESGGYDPIDHRADVYALAVVAYELLTGRVPFDSPNPLHILTQKMTLDPPSLRATGLAFPEEVEAVVLRGLARNPDERYVSAGEFAAELGLAILRMSRPNLPALSLPSEDQGLRSPSASGPVVASTWRSRPQATPPPAVGAETGETKKSRWRMPVALASVGLILGGAALLLSKDAVIPDEAASAAPVLPVLPPASPPPSARADEEKLVTPEEVLAESGAPSPAMPEDEEPTRASTLKEKRGRTRRTETSEERAKAAPVPPSSPAPPTVDSPGLAVEDRARAESLAREGTTALVAGRIPEAIAHFRSATLAHPRYAPAWRGLGLANERLGRAPEAKTAYRRYLELSPKASDADSVRARLTALE